jgi:hypothetical protein
MQSFPIQDRDILQVGNAPAVALQGVLDLVLTPVRPVLDAYPTVR